MEHHDKFRIAVGCDHGGWDLKEHITHLLTKWDYEWVNMGTDSPESVDYPDYGRCVVEAIIQGQVERGILICGTGIGMSIVANKYPGIRAALCHDEFTARMSREHNNANVLVLGGRVLDRRAVSDILQIWLKTEFAGGRHCRRLDKIAQIEQEVCHTR
jgi:ribose 5-phosphate isomerase B